MTASPSETRRRQAFSMITEVRSAAVWIAVLMLGLSGFSAMFPMDEAAMGSGFVVARGGNTPVQTTNGGSVKSVHVQEGQFVRRGQLLVLLDEKLLALTEARAGEPVVRLLALRQRLRAQVRGQVSFAAPTEYDSLVSERLVEAAAQAMAEQGEELARLYAGLENDLAEIRSNRTRLQRQLDSTIEQQAHSQAQLRLLTEEWEGLQRLEQQGYAASNRVRAAERAVASQAAMDTQLRAASDDLHGQIVEADLRQRSARSDFVRSASERLVDVELRLGGEMPQLGTATVELEQGRIQAPHDGWVLGLSAVGEGQVLAPGDSVLAIVPAHAERVVTAIFDARRGAQLQVGKLADIRVAPTGAGFRQVIHGRVDAVGADAQASETTPPTINATIILPRQPHDAGVASDLRPGTPVEVAVVTRRRTLLEYLFEPLFGVTWRAFREP